MTVKSDNGGVREGQGGQKALERWDLMPWDALTELAKVLGTGAIKYAPRNWERGMAWHDHYCAAVRHLGKFARGERIDESGYSHLAHAAVDIIFLLTYQIREIGNDDMLNNDHKEDDGGGQICS